MSAGLDADRNEYGTVTHASGHSNLLVTRIDDQVFDLFERTVPPCFQLFVE